ncbi:hypothetical protein [Roseibium algae]|uniref:Tryptophan synthase beta chain-like PALP domain-containing protein n=1 Tax=Roseibium algae TaxID=3123038 RepID=A0ABU8TQA8_9HYPH
MLNPITSPKIETHQGIQVVRDDLLPGSSKARIFKETLNASNADEFVYAGPGFGAAQIALAAVAYQLCKQATLFVSWRSERTRYTKEAESYGAKIIEVRSGYLSVLQSRARAYADETGAVLIPFGGGTQSTAITQAARSLDIKPRHVWCAGESGTLARSLKAAWPDAQLHVVKVGKDLPEISGARIYDAGCAFSKPVTAKADFPLHPNYEAKAWSKLRADGQCGNTLFWNVRG